MWSDIPVWSIPSRSRMVTRHERTREKSEGNHGACSRERDFGFVRRVWEVSKRHGDEAGVSFQARETSVADFSAELHDMIHAINEGVSITRLFGAQLLKVRMVPVSQPVTENS